MSLYTSASSVPIPTIISSTKITKKEIDQTLEAAAAAASGQIVVKLPPATKVILKSSNSSSSSIVLTTNANVDSNAPPMNDDASSTILAANQSIDDKMTGKRKRDDDTSATATASRSFHTAPKIIVTSAVPSTSSSSSSALAPTTISSSVASSTNATNLPAVKPKLAHQNSNINVPNHMRSLIEKYYNEKLDNHTTQCHAIVPMPISFPSLAARRITAVPPVSDDYLFDQFAQLAPIPPQLRLDLQRNLEPRDACELELVTAMSSHSTPTAVPMLGFYSSIGPRRWEEITTIDLQDTKLSIAPFVLR